MTTPLPEDSSFADTLAAWESASSDFIELVDGLTVAQWQAATALPGWSVGDIVAHVGWIEGLLVGRVDPPHEPDWAALPHVRNDFGRATEAPVDLRRSWTQAAVTAELHEVVAERARALHEGPQDAAIEVMGPLGPAPLGRVTRMRAMDTWVHEQDIRDAIGQPGHLDSPGARATAAQLLPGLPKVWVKGASAGPGQSLRVRVTGPEVVADVLVEVDADGRGRMVTDDAPASTTLTMPWTTYLALVCGRGDLAARRAEVVVEGDEELATRTLDAFTIML